MTFQTVRICRHRRRSTGSLTAEADLLLGHYGGAVVQRVAQHVAAHALARLVVKVLEERRKVFELENRQDVVVGVHRDLQQSGQLLGHRAAGRDAAEGKKVARLGYF